MGVCYKETLPRKKMKVLVILVVIVVSVGQGVSGSDAKGEATTPAPSKPIPIKPTPIKPQVLPTPIKPTPIKPLVIPAPIKPGKPLRNRCRASSECGGANTECKTYRCKCKEEEGFYEQNGQCLPINELFPGTRCDKKGNKGKNQGNECADPNSHCRGYGCLCDKGYKVTDDKRGCVLRVPAKTGNSPSEA